MLKIQICFLLFYLISEKCFPKVISSWESAAECILQREDMISALEKFERVASDPNRFFEKGIFLILYPTHEN